ncbi:hypothetical protein OWR29_13415 [Actinoplanes sp. Pm04-4]|uniref:Uncharacterized protein n=1 Tax=Paractinoplanes pyxinae TaxID=2997416 RepID=A0ABT4AYR7_9ACTN|nr:hypothetical protein [Actinoplanes pyxinae]MCY1139002.1 hypothetical protein [Actinoplanes pyxinae]
MGAAPKVVGAVADVVGMFRTEYAMAGRSMSPQGTPVVAEMSRLLRSRDVPSVVDGFGLTRGSKLLAGIQDLREARMRVEEKLSTHRAAVRPTKADAVADADRPEEEVDIARAALVGYADKVLTAVDAFLLAISTAPKDGGDPPLLGALLREALYAAQPDVSHVLFVSLDSIGVDIVDAAKRFGRDRWYSYFGGLQVSYLLLDASSGTTVSAGTVRRLGHARFDLETGDLSEHWTKPVGGPGRAEYEVKDGS